MTPVLWCGETCCTTACFAGNMLRVVLRPVRNLAQAALKGIHGEVQGPTRDLAYAAVVPFWNLEGPKSFERKDRGVPIEWGKFQRFISNRDRMLQAHLDWVKWYNSKHVVGRKRGHNKW